MGRNMVWYSRYELINETVRMAYLSVKSQMDFLFSGVEVNLLGLIETKFQIGYHYPNSKSRYQRIIKHKMWANYRCFWIDFVKIANNIAGSSLKNGQKLVNQTILTCLCDQIVKLKLTLYRFLQFSTGFGKDFSLFLGHQLFPLFVERAADGTDLKK